MTMTAAERRRLRMAAVMRSITTHATDFSFPECLCPTPHWENCEHTTDFALLMHRRATWKSDDSRRHVTYRTESSPRLYRQQLPLDLGWGVGATRKVLASLSAYGLGMYRHLQAAAPQRDLGLGGPSLVRRRLRPHPPCWNPMDPWRRPCKPPLSTQMLCGELLLRLEGARDSGQDQEGAGNHHAAAVVETP